MSLSILSIESWESDQASSDHLTTEEADRKFMRQFNKPAALRGPQSETLSTYKGSDASSDSQIETQVVRRIASEESIISSNESNHSHLSCPELVTNVAALPSQQFTNSHHLKNIKKLRKLNRSVKESSKPVTLPDITPKTNDPWQLEGFHVWSQLDGLNPLAPANETMTQYDQKSGTSQQYESKECAEDESAATLLVEIDNDGEESDGDLVKILEEEDQKMDNVLDGLLGTCNAENDDELQSLRKGQYMDISFEYYPMESIKEDSLIIDSSLIVAELIDEKPLNKPQLEECELDNLRLLKQFDIDLEYENTPIEVPVDNVFFKKLHNNFVENFVDELVQMSNDIENLVKEWKEPEEKAADHTQYECLGIDQQQKEKQITFKVSKLNEQEYFEDFCDMVDLSNYESSKFSMYLTDNFASVKRCFAINSRESAQIMSGFFVVDGMILDPYLENRSFEELKLDENSEIVLVTWSDEHYYASLFTDDEHLWDNVFA